MAFSENLKLSIIKGPFRGEEIALGTDDFSIGRTEENNFVIPDKTVSRKHAVISFDNGQFVIKDFSANGIKVNGVRVHEQPLMINSTIEIGPCTFLFNDISADKTILKTDGALPDETDHTQTKTDELLIREDDFNIDDEDEESEKKKESKSLFKSPIVIGLIAILFLTMVVSFFLPEKSSNKKRVMSNKPTQQFTEVNIPAGTIPGELPATVKSQADALFKAAEKYFSEDYAQVNLYEAITRWQRGIDMLAQYEKRPPSFQENVAKLKMAKQKLQQRFEDNKMQINIAMKRKQYDLALERVKVILESIPDKLDERYRWAKNNEIILNRLNSSK